MTRCYFLCVAGYFINQSRLRNSSKVYCNFTKFADLTILWELNSTRATSLRSQEENACKTHNVNRTECDESERYIDRLPFNKNKLKIGQSRDTAFKRFQFLETKLEKIPFLKLNMWNVLKTI